MDNNSRDIQLEQRIDAYIKGNLTEAEVDELWVELLQKPEYITLLETEIDLARFHQAKQQQQTTNGGYWKWIAAAAAVAILVISINVFSDNAPKPIEEWAETQITLNDNLASAEVTRSAAAADVSSADSLLNAGFKAALEGDTPQAIKIYENITTLYDDPKIIAKAHLNLGILQYNSGNYAPSIEHFKKAISFTQGNPLLKERSYWYMGNAFVNMNQLEEARTAVRETYMLGQIYKREAFKLLKRLDYELGYIDFDNFDQQIQEAE